MRLRRLFVDNVASERRPGLFYFNPDMLLYKDMEELKQRKTDGRLKFHSHNEVWGE